MEQKITIGRNPKSTVRIEERWDTVSNDHATIERRGDALLFFDHSSNGTIINGQKVQNTNVGIYPGDKILLAGVFELDWNIINRNFPYQHRPTVTRNIHGGEQNTGRRTVQMDNFSRRDNVQSMGRQTEQFTPGAVKDVSQNYVRPDRRENYGQANVYSQADMDRAMEKWNWGAFFCSWLWAVVQKMYWPLAILIIGGIPYVGQVCSLCLSVYLGLKGSRIAWESGKYKDFEAYKKAQHNWAVGGVIWFLISLVSSAYLVYTTLSIL